MTTTHRVVPRIDPGITRVRETGGGFSYVGPDGDPPDQAALERCRALALPPAWTDVWISADPRGHIQAVGVDAAGREQYRYHAAWKQHRAEVKFDRMLQLAGALPHARAAVTHDLRAGAPKEHALSMDFRILDEGSPRVGSIAYLEKYGSRGLTTLLHKDATTADKIVTLSFPAKEHTHDLIHLHDAELAQVIETAAAASEPSDRLLSYRAEDRHCTLDEAEINAYVHTVTGGQFTAKDFRTLRGTLAAATRLAEIGPTTREQDRKHAEVEAAEAASEALCNTPAVARSSYIDPRVFAQYAQGRILDRDGSPDRTLADLVEPE